MAMHANTPLTKRRHLHPKLAARDRKRAPLLRAPINAAQRARIERDVELLIHLLDMLDGDPPDSDGLDDLEPDTDREPDEECEPSDASEMTCDWLVTVHGGVPA